ncbi:MAG: SpoIIE family protein phosphatase [Candidatus Zixiibacteriota bacterium]|nr:MAG: SpoIIE family protein phosphatase [candidate division Zixibacteria bacterium]
MDQRNSTGKMLKLVGTDGKRFYSWNLEPGKYVIGRRQECDFPVPHKTVSGKHAEIEVTADGRYFVVDLESKNGTIVNGEKLTGRREVSEGDRIIFAQTEFRLAPADESDSLLKGPTRTKLSDHDPENSVFISIDEALKPLPAKVTERPELIPALFDMAKILVLPEPKEAMLQKSLEMISKVIPAERLAILAVSEDGEEVFTAASLLTGDKDPGSFRISRTIAKDIIADKNSILICDPLKDPKFAEKQSIITSELKSAIAVPLFDEGKVLGILYADTSNPVHRYNDEYLRVLATFGNIIASRLLNYELLHERQEKQIIEAELERASAIQKNLLEECPSDIPGYEICVFQEQSRSVGGDLYDTHLLPDGRLQFLVADVSGKGLGAALLMSNILASFRILYETEDFDLIQAVEKVSHQVLRHSDPGDFATLFAGILEPNNNRIRFINAGHNPPLIVRGNGTIEHLNASGLMIGAFDFPSWKEETVDLSEGDLLFAYSDGVTEAEGEIEQYGEDRMESLVVNARERCLKDIVEHLMDDIDEFTGGTSRSDDITILGIKRSKP